MSRKMRAAVLTGPKRIEVQDVPMPEALPGMVVVKVTDRYVCGSDLHGYVGSAGARQNPTGRPGHEWEGEVVEVGPGVNRIKVGQRVTGVAIQGCMTCTICQRGLPQLCRTGLQVIGFDIPGAFGDFLGLNEQWTIPLPDGLPPGTGALVEPISVAWHCVAERCGTVLPGDRVVVQGPGGIGIFCAFVLRAMGAIPLLTGLKGKDDVVRLPAAAKLGFATLAVESGESLSGRLKDALGVERVPLVIDTTGVAEAAVQGMEILETGGTLTPVAIYSRAGTVPLTAAVRAELSILTSYGSSLPDYLRAIQLLADGLITDLNLVATQFAFEAVNDAYLAALEGRCLRPRILV